MPMRLGTPLRTPLIQPNVKGLRPDQLLATVLHRGTSDVGAIYQVGNHHAHVDNQVDATMAISCSTSLLQFAGYKGDAAALHARICTRNSLRQRQDVAVQQIAG